MTGPTAFRAAVEAKDLVAIASTLAPGVELYSPVMVKPYRGKDRVTALLRVLLQTFEDFHYTDELIGAGGPALEALVFEARVMGKSIQGLDLVAFDDAGLVTSLVVMVRPLPAAMTLARAVGQRFEELAAV